MLEHLFFKVDFRWNGEFYVESRTLEQHLKHINVADSLV